MKIGIIIIFHNSENIIDKDFFISHLKQIKSIKFCFVNNASLDKTYLLLKEIKDYCKSVSLVDVKKHTTKTAATKAGARFLFNKFELNHIGYVSTVSLAVKEYNLNEFLKAIIANKDFILEYDIKILETHKIKKPQMSRIFSVIEYLKILKPTKQLLAVQNLF